MEKNELVQYLADAIKDLATINKNNFELGRQQQIEETVTLVESLGAFLSENYEGLPLAEMEELNKLAKEYCLELNNTSIRLPDEDSLAEQIVRLSTVIPQFDSAINKRRLMDSTQTGGNKTAGQSTAQNSQAIAGLFKMASGALKGSGNLVGLTAFGGAKLLMEGGKLSKQAGLSGGILTKKLGKLGYDFLSGLYQNYREPTKQAGFSSPQNIERFLSNKAEQLFCSKGEKASKSISAGLAALSCGEDVDFDEIEKKSMGLTSAHDDLSSDSKNKFSPLTKVVKKNFDNIGKSLREMMSDPKLDLSAHLREQVAKFIEMITRVVEQIKGLFLGQASISSLQVSSTYLQ